MNVALPPGQAAARTIRAPLDRAAFFALIGDAVRVAEPDSSPVLMVIELAGLSSIAAANGPVAALVDAVAGRIAGVLGEEGYVSIQRSGRIALVVEDEGASAIDALSTALLGSLVRPVVADGVTLAPGAALGIARWGRDGMTAEELFVAADQAIGASAANEIAPSPTTSIQYRPSPLRRAQAA